MPTLDVEALVASQQTGRSNSGCQTCNWLATRPADERSKWVKVLGDPKRWTHVSIFRAMKLADKSGSTPGRSSVEGHRNNDHASRA